MLAGRPPHLRIVVGSAHEQYINVLCEALAHNPDGLEPRIVLKEPTNVYVVLIKADEMVSAQNDRFMASVIEWLPKDQPDQRAFSARYMQDGTNHFLLAYIVPGFGETTRACVQQEIFHQVYVNYFGSEQMFSDCLAAAG